jgi:hypothetical protein
MAVPTPPPPLPAGTKTNVTAVETALNTAINALSPTDRYQAGTLQTLKQMRRLLAQVKVERSQ